MSFFLHLLERWRSYWCYSVRRNWRWIRCVKYCFNPSVKLLSVGEDWWHVLFVLNMLFQDEICCAVCNIKVNKSIQLIVLSQIMIVITCNINAGQDTNQFAICIWHFQLLSQASIEHWTLPGSQEPVLHTSLCIAVFF